MNLEDHQIIEAFLSVAPLSTLIVGWPDGKIIKYNRKFLDTFSIDEKKIESLKFSDLVVFEEDSVVIKTALISKNLLKDVQIQMVKGDGSYFLAAITADKLLINNKSYLLIIVDNLTLKQDIEDENSKLLEELDISRTQIEEEAAKMNLFNIQLEESEHKLEELNASKDKMFSIIGHDLKNPFFVISSYAEIINEDYDSLSDEDKRSYIQIIGETSLYASKLLSNLLDWARTQTGRIEFKPQRINLSQFSIESIELHKAQAMKKNIELNSAIDTNINVNCDKNMLDTIFRNLVSNALKFTPENGSIKINANDEGEMIVVSVTDSGIGMTPEDISKLFRVGVSNSEIGKSKEKGTGLGLLLSKEFVEKHGGKIWVESEPEKGSCFYFSIPKQT